MNGTTNPTDPITSVEQDWLFSFVDDHATHSGHYVVIRGTHDSARAEMVRRYGQEAWAMQFGATLRGYLEDCDLTELPPDVGVDQAEQFTPDPAPRREPSSHLPVLLGADRDNDPEDWELAEVTTEPVASIELAPTPLPALTIPTEQVFLLREAVLRMVIRYGRAMQDYAYALDSTGDERARLLRAVDRRFRAIQRLTRALARVAAGGAR